MSHFIFMERDIGQIETMIQKVAVNHRNVLKKKCVNHFISCKSYKKQYFKN